MSDGQKEQLLAEIRKLSQNGKIACRQCFDLARNADVSLKIIGDICNENDIRICACQLGCFK